MNAVKSVAARVSLAIVLALIVLLTIFPSLDLGISTLFFTPDTGFTIDGVWYERMVYRSVQYLLILVGLGLLLMWVNGRRLAPEATKLISGRQLVFLLLLLALGPGLLVNEGMKENWGRSRPVDLLQFGGDKTFSPAFVFSDQGGKSFPSGHAAAAFYLVAVAFVVVPRRRLWLWLAFGYGVLVGGMRVASGGHFLSDVVTSVLVVWLMTIVLYRLVFGRMPAWSDDKA